MTIVVPGGGSGGGSIDEITSEDDSVTITDPTGPTVDLSVAGGSGTITEITSEDDSVTITNPDGPIVDLSVAGGGGSFPDYTGSGSPEGVQTATFGKWYVDTQGGDPVTTGSGGLYFKTTDSGNTGWVMVGGNFNNLSVTGGAGIQFIPTGDGGIFCQIVVGYGTGDDSSLTIENVGTQGTQLEDNGGGGISINASPGALSLTGNSAGSPLGLVNSGGGGINISTQQGGGGIQIDDDLTFAEGAVTSEPTGPVITDQSDGHTYRIISTAGVLSTQQVT